MTNFVRVAGASNAADEMLEFGLLAQVTVSNASTHEASDYVSALIDTGAYITTVHRELAERLQLEIDRSEEFDVVGARNRKAGISRCAIGFQSGHIVKLGKVAIDDLPGFCPVIVGRDIIGLGQLIVDFETGGWVLHINPEKLDILV
ncbi:MAG: hypothetical protein ABL883_13500 [Terricaulis sp.]